MFQKLFPTGGMDMNDSEYFDYLESLEKRLVVIYFFNRRQVVQPEKGTALAAYGKKSEHQKQSGKKQPAPACCKKNTWGRLYRYLSIENH